VRLVPPGSIMIVITFQIGLALAKVSGRQGGPSSLWTADQALREEGLLTPRSTPPASRRSSKARATLDAVCITAGAAGFRRRKTQERYCNLQSIRSHPASAGSSAPDAKAISSQWFARNCPDVSGGSSIAHATQISPAAAGCGSRRRNEWRPGAASSPGRPPSAATPRRREGPWFHVALGDSACFAIIWRSRSRSHPKIAWGSALRGSAHLGAIHGRPWRLDGKTPHGPASCR